MRYLLQQSKSVADGWVCTDTENGIVVEWRQGLFNETQNVVMLDDYHGDVMDLAKLMREMGDWLAVNHKDKVMKQ